MSIIKRSKSTSDGFTIISKKALNDKNLSWKAKGILTYLIGKPADWVIYLSDLEKQSTDGRDATRSGIDELIKFGYIIRIRVKGEDGKFMGYDYEVSDVPSEKTTEEPVKEYEPIQEQKEPTKKETYEKTSLKDCFDLQNFEIVLLELGFKNVNSQYYYNKITTITEEKNVKKTIKEWTSYIKMWLEDDDVKGKLQTSKKSSPQVTQSKSNEIDEQDILRELSKYEKFIFENTYTTENAINSLKERLRELYRISNTNTTKEFIIALNGELDVCLQNVKDDTNVDVVYEPKVIKPRNLRNIKSKE
jgi:hypothetical protein